MTGVAATVRSRVYGVRRQSAAATAHWLNGGRSESGRTFATVSQSGVALRLPPHSKNSSASLGDFATGPRCPGAYGTSALAGVVIFHPLADVLVTDVHRVDFLELLDGLILPSHFVEKHSKLVDHVLLLVVEDRLFLQGFL